MKDIKDLIEKIVQYTRTWSISENEWYCNVNCDRLSQEYKNGKREDSLSSKEFERAIREEIGYCLLYQIDSIGNQMESDYMWGYEGKEKEYFEKDSKEIEKEIQKYYKDFKIERV